MPFDAGTVATKINKTAEEARGKLAEQEQARLLVARLYIAASESSDRLAEWSEAVIQAEQHTYSSYALPVQTTSPNALDYPLHPPFDELGYRVVATDSSFIEADKHRGAFCHLINVAQAMIKYGDEQEALVEAIPHHYPDYLLPRARRRVDPERVMQVQCAAHEIKALYAMAQSYDDLSLAIFDGPLNQTLARLNGAESKADAGGDRELNDLLAGFDDTVKDFARQLHTPIVGYNSRTKSDLVIRSLEEALSAGFFSDLSDTEHRLLQSALGYLDDGDLFSVLLAPGERSLAFTAWQPAKNKRKDLSENRIPIISFYLGVGDGAATGVERIDTLADFGPQLDTIQRVLVSQCSLGNGYPPVLNLADRYAFLTRGGDRETYFALLENEGLLKPPSLKSKDKQNSGRNV